MGVGRRGGLRRERHHRRRGARRLLAFRSDDGLVALDPATGREAWTVRLRGNADCGPMVSPTGADPASEALVCLQGTGNGAEREVRRGGA